MKTKTYFCSDTHFNHPNILRYEPQRLNAIAKYIVENSLVQELLKELYHLDGIYGAIINWRTTVEDCECFSESHQEEILVDLFECIINNEFYYNLVLKGDEEESSRELQKERIKVILNYQTEMFVAKWNSVVNDDDLVYFLGDFGFGNEKELEEIGRRLRGHKTIIIGNHDGRKYDSDKTIIYNPTLINHFKACGFERIEFNPIILKGCFILSHEPLYYMNESMPYFNIYGHVHSNPMFKTKTENSLCACLDRWDYKPIEIKEYNEYIPE